MKKKVNLKRKVLLVALTMALALHGGVQAFAGCGFSRPTNTPATQQNTDSETPESTPTHDQGEQNSKLTLEDLKKSLPDGSEISKEGPDYIIEKTLDGRIVLRFCGNELTEKIGNIAQTYGITDVIAPNATKIDITAFAGCVKLRRVFAPNVDFINLAAFLGCINLNYIDLTSVVEIRSSAFSDCFNLTDIGNLPSLKKIGRCAFVNCLRLKNFPF